MRSSILWITSLKSFPVQEGLALYSRLPFESTGFSMQFQLRFFDSLDECLGFSFAVWNDGTPNQRESSIINPALFYILIWGKQTYLMNLAHCFYWGRSSASLPFLFLSSPQSGCWRLWVQMGSSRGRDRQDTGNLVSDGLNWDENLNLDKYCCWHQKSNVSNGNR